MTKLLRKLSVDYKKDFSWLENCEEIIVSESPLKKYTDLSLLAEASRSTYCEKIVFLYFLMIFSSPYLFLGFNSKSFYLDKKTNKLHWYPGKKKIKLSNKSQMQIYNNYKRIYVDSKTDNLDASGFFWTKPKNSAVFDRLVRIHMRAHFDGPLDFDFGTEIINALRSLAFLAMNRLVPSTDLINFSRIIVRLHVIFVRAGIPINFKPIAQRAFAMSQLKLM